METQFRKYFERSCMIIYVLHILTYTLYIYDATYLALGTLLNRPGESDERKICFTFMSMVWNIHILNPL